MPNAVMRALAPRAPCPNRRRSMPNRLCAVRKAAMTLRRSARETWVASDSHWPTNRSPRPIFIDACVFALRLRSTNPDAFLYLRSQFLRMGIAILTTS
jgi:hypothetical protein